MTKIKIMQMMDDNFIIIIFIITYLLTYLLTYSMEQSPS